jgi:hypothetical protein
LPRRRASASGVGTREGTPSRGGDVPMSETAKTEGAAFEVATLLPGFSSLKKRSGELDGSLPVRAARYCGPVFEGSAAGFQITLAQPMTVARDRRGKVACDMTPPALRQVTEQVDEALERGIKAGLMARGGHWDRLLRGDAMPIRGNRLTVWTGHMIRPRAGIWLLVGGAFNRRSRVAVVDHIASDPDHFVPLLIEIDTRDITSQPAWMESELGCVTPLSPAATIRKEALTSDSAELKQFGEFFSEEYFEIKAKHPTGAYIRRQREHRVKATPDCEARLLHAGPDVHSIQEFARFVTPNGFSRQPSSPGTLQFALVRNFAPTRWTWQGQTHSLFQVHKERHVPALEAMWKEAFGETRPSGLAFLSGYLAGEVWDQPYVQFQPWVLTSTPPGWSMLVDGAHRPPAYDGMRAVIATDWFFALAMVYRIYGPSSVRIPYRAPMLRALPVPRGVLALGMKESTV